MEAGLLVQALKVSLSDYIGKVHACACGPPRPVGSMSVGGWPPGPARSGGQRLPGAIDVNAFCAAGSWSGSLPSSGSSRSWNLLARSPGGSFWSVPHGGCVFVCTHMHARQGDAAAVPQLGPAGRVLPEGPPQKCLGGRQWGHGLSPFQHNAPKTQLKRKTRTVPPT